MHSPVFTLIEYHGQECKVKIVHPQDVIPQSRHSDTFVLYTKPSFANICTGQEKKPYLMDSYVFGRECSCIVAADWLSS